MESFFHKEKVYKAPRVLLSIWAWLEVIGGAAWIYLAYDYDEQVYVGEQPTLGFNNQLFNLPRYETDSFNEQYFLIGCCCLVLALILFIIIKVALKPIVEANTYLQGVPIVFRQRGSKFMLLVNGKNVAIKKTDNDITPINDVESVPKWEYYYAECRLGDGRLFRFIWVNYEKHLIYFDKELVVRDGFVIANRMNNGNVSSGVNNGMGSSYMQQYSNILENKTFAPIPQGVYSLKAIAGSKNGQVWPINEPIRIGRNEVICQISYAATTPGVSRTHCEVGFDGEKLYIKDLGATYGTQLSDGTMVKDYQQYEMNENTTFTIGNTETFVVVKNQ